MTSAADPFESPKILVEGVQDEDIGELKAKEAAYWKTRPYTHITEIHPTTGYQICKVRFPSSPPKPIRRLVSRIIKDLRDALDQAVWNGSKQLGATGANIYFPFATSPADLAGAFARGYCRDVPPEIRPFLSALQPYPSGLHGDGDDFLKWLSMVSGPNKHRMMLGIGPSTEPPCIHEYAAASVQSAMKWDESNHEFTIGEFAPETTAKYDLTVPVHIGFANAPEAMQGVPAWLVLTHLASKVQSIVLGIEAETARILRSRGGP